jgi:hypothetical protein
MSTELQQAVDKLSNTAIAYTLIRKHHVLAATFQMHDPRFRQIVCAVARLLRHCEQGERGKGALCLNCDTEFGKTVPLEDFWIITPYLVDWSAPDGKLLITGICTKCSRKSDEMLEAIGMRRMQSIWPDLRVVGVDVAVPSIN